MSILTSRSASFCAVTIPLLEAQGKPRIGVSRQELTRETIDDVVLRFFFDLPLEKFLSVQLDLLGELQWPDGPRPLQLDRENQILAVSLPYLRSFKLYEQRVILTVVADGYPRINKVVGGGRDWQAQYLPYEERQKRDLRKRLLRLFRQFTVTALVLIIFVWTFYAYLFPVASLRGSGWNLRFGIIIGSVFGFILAGLLGAAYMAILVFWKRITAIRKPRPSWTIQWR